MRRIYAITKDLRNSEIIELGKRYGEIPFEQWEAEIEVKRWKDVLILKPYEVRDCLKKWNLIKDPK